MQKSTTNRLRSSFDKLRKRGSIVAVSSYGWLAENNRWEKISMIILAIAVPFLAFYNIKYNPRTWHDEGAALSLAKALAEKGIYGVQSGNEIQSFGPVQSVGPTVIYPIAIVYRIFGVGLIQGRTIAAFYLMFTILMFFFSSQLLFGRRTALLATFIVLFTPTTKILLYGRQVIGEVPALGLFLIGWYIWALNLRSRRVILDILAGLLFGLSLVTKNQYLIIGIGSFLVLILFDIIYYHQKITRSIGILVSVGLLVYAFWILWQWNYFGAQNFYENLSKLSTLASATSGFNISSTISALQYLSGTGSGHFYIFWGLPAVIYGFYLARKRNLESIRQVSLLMSSTIGLLYFCFWIIPWPHYLLASAVITAIFVGKMFIDILDGLFILRRNWHQFDRNFTGFITPLILGGVISILTMSFWLIYEFQSTLRSDILDKIGPTSADGLNLPYLQDPFSMAELLQNNVDKEAVIETWERELCLLTDLTYHYPDQVLLAKSHAAVYREGLRDYSLGKSYFETVRPDYLVIGWYSRLNQIYDLIYLQENSELIASVGDGDWRYDLYKMDSP